MVWYMAICMHWQKKKKQFWKYFRFFLKKMDFLNNVTLWYTINHLVLKLHNFSKSTF